MREERAAFSAAGAAGLAAACGQVLIIREALILWSGFELAAGLILASWLLFAAGGGALGGLLFSRVRRGVAGLAAGLPVMALALPASLLAMRAVRPAAGLGPGEMPGLDVLLAAALVVPAPAAAASGLLYAAAWSVAGAAGSAPRPLRVYLFEAAGSAVGGVLLACVLLPSLDALQACLVVSALLAGVDVFRLGLLRRRWRWILAWCAVAGAVAAGLAFSGPLSRASRTWQWGWSLAKVRDTPYQNLALLRRGGQRSLFANGNWVFSTPDPRTVQPAVHFPLLMHPDPHSALILEGGPAGAPREALRHPGVERVDFVLQDPGVLEIMPNRPPRDSRLDVAVCDPAEFVRVSGARWDVIILGAGDPLSVGTNRLFSVEFFRDLKARLAPGGVLAVSVSGPALSPGPAKLAQLRSILATLEAVFPRVLATPGDEARFFAGDENSGIRADQFMMAERISRRDLVLDHLRPDTVREAFNPFTVDRLQQALEAEPGRVNTDFRPLGFLHAMILQAQAAAPVLAERLLDATGVGWGTWWLMAAGAALAVFAASFSRRRGRPVAVASFLAGGSLMVYELALLVGCQVALGALYSRLALLIAAFMAGLAVGSAVAGSLGRRLRPGQGLLWLQLLLAAVLAGTGPALLVLREAPAAPAEAALYAMALFGGALGGAHYALAVACLCRGEAPSVRAGAGLYALDLAGAMALSTAASLLLIPLFGVTATGFGLALFCLACAPGLARSA